jgi:hypothetical protein
MNRCIVAMGVNRPMNPPVQHKLHHSDQPTPNAADAVASAMDVSRRKLLTGGALLGIATIIQGCAGRRSAGGTLPSPRWPDQDAVSSGPDVGAGTWSGSHGSGSSRPATLSSGPSSPPSLAGVMPRSAWVQGTPPKMQFSKPMRGVQRITVHHDALNTNGGRGQAWAVERLNSIRRSHMGRGREWVDIGYHYIIDPDGRVWEGRPISIEGAHVAATNDHNLGIMCMGNFVEQRPTPSQISTLDDFVAAQMRIHRVPITRIYTHQELKQTACPGRNLQRYMVQTRSRSGTLASLA